ncbi:hypothetical protein CDD82_4997 [Ophiocordyceps australis]|uniref:Endonuclease III homolog n=1 Tax=Ophiocordyceps australis TaxID=1399860 RepID=A0A2C5ZTS0_9HYPO|nr:hypothetical protein CDD82_4997 [Ophiocordyceps australis]
MRSSRISQDASKVFDRVSSAASPPCRVTRSLSRFAYIRTATETATPDIEDGITAQTAAPKRRREVSPASTRKTMKQELQHELPETVEMKSQSPLKTPRRVRKGARKTIDSGTGEEIVTPPSDWQEMYRTVEKMRAPGGIAHGAPVDSMGCERLADPEASPRDRRFHTLVALMLSSQTKDTVNAVAMERLKKELPPHQPGAPAGLNLENMVAVDAKLLNELIWAVGFHNNKTKYLKQTAVLLRDRWKGDVPDTIEGLVSLPGVGPKMAFLCLSAAWQRTEGIGVDVHVHRITNLWGWNKTKAPEETRLALQAWLPRDKWRDVNWLLVGLGQTICLPVGRRCGDCDLGLQGLCKSAERKKVAQGRRLDKTGSDVGIKVEEAKRQVTVKREVVDATATTIR